MKLPSGDKNMNYKNRDIRAGSFGKRKLPAVVSGIRVVYKIERMEDVMKIIVISARTDEQVYREAAKRRQKYEL